MPDYADAAELHDLLDETISRGRAGEWHAAVESYGKLDEKLQRLLAG